ncbi:MAG: DinB family protein [Planctomycetota bacterium]
MYTQNALLDMHERCHRTFAKLLEHCTTLTEEELHRELDGFGYPTIQAQLHHVISAEKYWTGVICGRMDAEDTQAQYPTVASLQAFRSEVAQLTQDCIRGIAEEALNAARPMKTWGDKDVELVPALVCLRPLTHAYHHQGQVLAMCRLLGKPANGFDFPLT